MYQPYILRYIISNIKNQDRNVGSGAFCDYFIENNLRSKMKGCPAIAEYSQIKRHDQIEGHSK